jgi:PfaB family protein
LEPLARSWYLKNRSDSDKKIAVSIVGGRRSQLETSIQEAKAAVSTRTPQNMNGSGGVSYAPSPLGPDNAKAFVFPGSGNHYVGMGRSIGAVWPKILRAMDAETLQLKTQLLPGCYVPWRTSWAPGWETAALERIASDPLNMIFGQVVHGGVMANLVESFGIKSDAVIGYSLGESAGLFAMGAWPDRGEMLKRMLATDLFSTELAGPCNAARRAWNIPADEDIHWCAAVVNRPGDRVRKIIDQWPHAKLLIVNTPDQCVIGGMQTHVEAVIRELGCDAVFLQGVVTVHCDAAAPVAEDYRKLHVFPTTPPENIRFYSCAQGSAYRPTSETAAASILDQALSGFNFKRLIEQAYEDGIRIFLEMGPHASCTGMIKTILREKPHLAVSACCRGEEDPLTILKFLGALISERVPVDLDKLYGIDAYPPMVDDTSSEKPGTRIKRVVGGLIPSPALPETPVAAQRPKESKEMPSQETRQEEVLVPGEAEPLPRPVPRDPSLPKEDPPIPSGPIEYAKIIENLTESTRATADAHKAFLNFSDTLRNGFEKTFATQTRLLKTLLSNGEPLPQPASPEVYTDLPEDTDKPQRATPVTPGDTSDAMAPPAPEPAFNRDMCMEFAVGSVAKVLGPEFAVVDTHKVRVRLPDEPLMLVDRIISVTGEKRSLKSGRVVTEHDVLPGAWYLDGGRTPVCISVEAGQADLFLCSYLGIDHAVKGKRSYRLLDAVVKFHRGLPKPGDVIRYEIEIDHFSRQGETYLFFFKFEGYIGDSHLISMYNGCAGFFTEEEVRNSGGILLTEEDTRSLVGKKPLDWKNPVPLYPEKYDDAAVEALRRGELSRCFGPLFDGIRLPESLRLPGGRMKLIHRILGLDPEGGRYGLGQIRAEADIHPDDWFLTCHFMDDMVMPGTLMYECCAHTLRVFIQRLGWVTDKPDACYEPLTGVESVLKCRGPVTPDTRHVWYEIDIKELGYGPEPYVIADALMYADGHRIVSFKDMSLKMTHVTREDIESFWAGKKDSEQKTGPLVPKTALYDRDRILAFAVGKPSEAFGEPYEVFDRERVIARLPGPPYSFLDRVVAAAPEPWVLKPGGWIDAEYDVPADEWYFRADRSASMPFCILLEIALQPCGWLAAYLGSALRSNNDLKFRNLGGNARLNRTILRKEKTLTIRARMTKVSEAADMIIEHFDFMVLQAQETVYSGDTYFGFFSKQALANQVGIRGAEDLAYTVSPDELERSRSRDFTDDAPLSPDDPDDTPAPSLSMPSKAIRMIDRIDVYVPDGGPQGLGFIRGVKTVDPAEWFFKAHFYQDPVCPGSLGIESFLQLVKFAAMDRWEHLADTHRFEWITDQPHQWTYRGQVTPENKRIEVEAVITKIVDTPVPAIYANGFLKVDGRYIYQMENFGFRLVPK